jgi:hypothetical protein
MKNYSLLICFCLLGKIGLAQDVTTRITHVQGGQLGAIDLTMLGGYAPYDFSWTGPNNFRAFTEDINGLQSGQYCVDVSDAHCGTLNLCVIVEECSSIIARFNQTAPCQGQSNGSLTAVTYSAARQPLRYQWSNGQTTQTATNLAAGIYNVTITDAVGCTDTRSEMLLPQTIWVDGIVRNACTGGHATGGVTLQANIIPTSRSGMMDFRWSNGSTEPNLTGVGAGTYTVTVSGGNNCTQTARFTIRNEFEENVLVQLGDKENSSYCDRRTMACDGRIDLAVIRTDRPLNFNWWGPNGPRTGQSISDLCAGDYRVTVSDNNGCQRTLPPITLCCCENDFETTGTASNPLCSRRVYTAPTVTLVPQSPDYSNQNTGSIQLNITGNPSNIGGYIVRWEGPGVTGSSQRTLTGLGVGRYCATVKDGCYTVEQCVTLVACKEQTITITGTASPSCECPTNTTSCNIGSIQNVRVTGGTAPYKYQWSNGNQSQNLSGLSAGQYCVTVTTANGCQQTKCFTVSSTALVERLNRTDCSWVDKVCPLNQAIIQSKVRHVGSTLVQDFNACKLDRRCIDGSIQPVFMGITRVQTDQVLQLRDGSLICADITECAMPNSNGSFQAFVATRASQKSLRKDEIGFNGDRCDPRMFQVNHYCGSALLKVECIPVASRDSNGIASVAWSPALDSLRNRVTDTVFNLLPNAFRIGAKDSLELGSLKTIQEQPLTSQTVSQSYQIERIFPNPFQENLSIHLNVGSATELHFKLLNVLGTVVFEQKQSLSKGFHQIVLEMPRLAAGVYSLEMVSKEVPKKTVHKMVRF